MLDKLKFLGIILIAMPIGVIAILTVGCDEYPGIEDCLFSPNQNFEQNPECITTAIAIAQDWQEMKRLTEKPPTIITQPRLSNNGDHIIIQYGVVEAIDVERLPPIRYRDEGDKVKHPQRSVVLVRATQKPHGWYVELFYSISLSKDNIRVLNHDTWNDLPALGEFPLISGFLESEQSGGFRNYEFDINCPLPRLYLVIPFHTNVVLTRE